jgi:molybdate transport repressor ModE-like protein
VGWTAGTSTLPDWNDVRVLLSVVETGSFSATARVLGLTQPTVSRRIARLEEIAGALLVERGKRGATLTPAGQKVAADLHVAHGMIDRAFSGGKAARQRDQPVTLLTSDGIAAYWLAHFLPLLFDLHPELDLRAITAGDANVLERHSFDVAVHHMRPNDPNLIALRLGHFHFAPFASHRYLSRRGRPRSTADLVLHSLLDTSLHLIDQGTWMTRLSAHEREARSQYFTNSSAVLVESVRRSAGIALLPTFGIVFETNLEALDLGLNFATPFWLCYPKVSLEKQAARIAIGFLKHVFDRRTMPWFADDYVRPRDFPQITPEGVMATYSSSGLAISV